MFDNDFIPGVEQLDASLSIATPTWAWQFIPASLSIAPPPHVSIPADLTISAEGHKALRATLSIRQQRGRGVLFHEMNWYKGTYDSFEDQLSAAMGGSGQAAVVAAAIMAPAYDAPGNGVP